MILTLLWASDFGRPDWVGVRGGLKGFTHIAFFEMEKSEGSMRSYTLIALLIQWS